MKKLLAYFIKNYPFFLNSIFKTFTDTRMLVVMVIRSAMVMVELVVMLVVMLVVVLVVMLP